MRHDRKPRPVRPKRLRSVRRGPSSIDFEAGQLTCPAGVPVPFIPGKAARFPEGACAAARYRGTRKNLSGPRRVAVVRDLRIIARQPDSDFRPAA